MRRIVSTVLACVVLALEFPLKAQEASGDDLLTSTVIGLVGKDYAKVATETTTTGELFTGYAYMEVGRGYDCHDAPNYLYSQIFWEQKWWEAPLFLHAEFRTTLFDGALDNTYYGGLAWCFYSKHGFVALEPMYRYEQAGGHGFQFSAVGGWEWTWCDLAHYTDVWHCQATLGALDLYSETRFYVKVSKRLRLGLVGTLDYGKPSGLSAALYGGAKWML